MEMINVNSSNIKSIGYDAATSTLFVTYATGKYCYNNVSADLFNRFLSAESKGRFMAEEIKGKYTYSKL